MKLCAMLILTGSLAGGCARPAPPPAPASPPDVAGAPPQIVPAASCGAQAEMDALDGRVPVPLLPMMAHHQKQSMQDHLLAVQEIVIAAGERDFPALERAARRIGTSEQMTRMCRHMGAGARGFSEEALRFHETADTIAAAAGRRDARGALQALGRTVQTCTGCHAVWKQSVVDQATFARLGGAAGARHPQ